MILQLEFPSLPSPVFGGLRRPLFVRAFVVGVERSLARMGRFGGALIVSVARLVRVGVFGARAVMPVCVAVPVIAVMQVMSVMATMRFFIDLGEQALENTLILRGKGKLGDQRALDWGRGEQSRLG